MTQLAPQNDFDFSLGEWEGDVVRYAPDGSITTEAKGTWTAKSSLEGKVIEDHFVQLVDDKVDAAAFTLRTYCEETQQWEMTYLWAGQPSVNVIAFIGNRVDNEMHLNVQQPGPNGFVVMARIRFFDITDDGFSWENRTSLDNGATWYLATSIRLRRRKDGT